MKPHNIEFLDSNGASRSITDVDLVMAFHSLPFSTRIRAAGAVLRDLEKFTPRRGGWTADELFAHADLRDCVNDMKDDLRSLDSAATVHAIDLVAKHLIDAGWRRP